MSLLELFCDVDDFWQAFEPGWLQAQLTQGTITLRRKMQLCESEIMTILILFHQSNYRTFKALYIEYVMKHLSNEFPNLVSYSRFVSLKPRVIMPLLVYQKQYLGNCTGISFIDSTPLVACHNRRINRHKIFAGYAARGKITMGWFYGFKLHLVVNDRGEVITFSLAPGNVDDRQPVPQLAQDLFGKLFADKGYISHSLFEQLFAHDVQLITSVRKNMQNRLMSFEE